ncbi:MAG: S41 family peptidase [Dehalococcoidia bacterium]|nr:S41 family peptidase [Dehalococcoidia bacterium]
MNIKRRLPLILLAVLLIVLSFEAGFQFSQSLTHPDTEFAEEFHSLHEAWQNLQQYYVNKTALDPDELSKGAINGLLEALDDPYTSYFESYELAWSAFEGSFEGIGAVVTMEDGELTVVSPIVGTPAAEAGVRAGDKILEINGQSTSGMSLAEAVLNIRGPQGTTVTLLILHQGETTPVEIEIVRERIELKSVYLEMLPDNIAHIRITYFSERTHEELVTALNDTVESGARGIILDLRGNPGGLLDSVVAVASEFLDGGIVLYEADDEGNIIKEWQASSGGLATDLPLAVLVDGGSASGSEVLAGALQDRGRAKLIGTTTYGKGSVCTLQVLSDGSALYITTARWLTPNGHMIEGVGLTPDIEVAMTEEDIESGRDPQLEFAIEYIEGALKLEMLEGVW